MNRRQEVKRSDNRTSKRHDIQIVDFNQAKLKNLREEMRETIFTCLKINLVALTTMAKMNSFVNEKCDPALLAKNYQETAKLYQQLIDSTAELIYDLADLDEVDLDNIHVESDVHELVQYLDEIFQSTKINP